MKYDLTILLLGLIVGAASLAVSSIDAAVTATATAATATSVKKADTVLDDQFCQHYYTLPDDDDDTSNKIDCPTLRSKIRSEIRGNGTPTLELGNKETQPAMVLIHGWPDTSAIWAVSTRTPSSN